MHKYYLGRRSRSPQGAEQSGFVPVLARTSTARRLVGARFVALLLVRCRASNLQLLLLSLALVSCCC